MKTLREEMMDTSYKSIPTGFIWIPLAGWVPVRADLPSNNRPDPTPCEDSGRG